ncbi:TPA: hypothetical protein RQK06_004284 [Vibrio vulnificus]|nr:hypothetical protein [Vibrio vulnificus]
MALEQSYYELWFESFTLQSISGHRSSVQLRLIQSQSLPDEITNECALRGSNPFELLTEFSKKLFHDYPVGTKFKLKAKLTDREGEGMFLYSYYRWAPIEILKATA